MNMSFLPGLQACQGVEEAQVGETLPGVPGHLAEERDPLPCRPRRGKGEDEVFRIGASGRRSARRGASGGGSNRGGSNAARRSSSPCSTFIETQAAQPGRTRHLGPGGGFFGDRQGPGNSPWTMVLSSLRKSMASRFSRPP